MIRTINFSQSGHTELELFTREKTDESVESAVAEIISQVRGRGDEALIEYTELFDHVRIHDIKVGKAELDNAADKLEPGIMKIMKSAAENIKLFHSRQIRCGFAVADIPGVILGQRITAIERVGMYVPGGTASYPSTVLMNAIPAKLAGVEKLIMCTPPGPDGSVAPAILAAARIAGVDEIYKVGGAQAIAAMAYGTETVPRVFKIIGPGNAFVAAAKRSVFGQVDIDMIAGPSDVLIIADDTASARVTAADMLAQAEHDENSSAVLVTDSRRLAKEAAIELERQLEDLPRRDIARKALEKNSMIILAADLTEAVTVSNIMAPEHLEIMTRNPFALLSEVKNAGSIFLGKDSPEALGDYFAGPNHTIPTMGTAKFRSPLSVDDFIKKSSFTYYNSEALEGVSGQIARFARQEGLEGHARSAEIRFEEIK